VALVDTDWSRQPRLADPLSLSTAVCMPQRWRRKCVQRAAKVPAQGRVGFLRPGTASPPLPIKGVGFYSWWGATVGGYTATPPTSGDLSAWDAKTSRIQEWRSRRISFPWTSCWAVMPILEPQDGEHIPSNAERSNGQTNVMRKHRYDKLKQVA
jgi:hypothetical protein